MTDFVKANFTISGDYIFYGKPKDENFIVRLKHRGPFTKAKFLKELIANHSVESYFADIAEGKAPLAILRSVNEEWYRGILGRSFR